MRKQPRRCSPVTVTTSFMSGHWCLPGRPQGARRENTGSICPTSNAAGGDASAAECHRIHESQH
jgi:hypothetical protein